MGRAAVQAEFLALALAGRSDVSEAAGDEKPSRERAEPALTLGLVQRRCDDAVRGDPGQWRASVLGEAQVHAAVGDDIERQAATRPEPERSHSAGRPIIEDERLYSR